MVSIVQDDDDECDAIEDAEQCVDISNEQPANNTPRLQEADATVQEIGIKWFDDLERKTLLERRKIVEQVATKERQMAETKHHMDNGSCPKAIKATAQLPVPEFLRTEVDAQLQKVIRDYELGVLTVQGYIREAEVARLSQTLEQLFPRHLSEVQKRKEELMQAGILPTSTQYDEEAFIRRLSADEQKTKFLTHKSEWAKQEKRAKLAEKKAAERTEESLLDPEIAQLRKDVAQLKKKADSAGGKKSTQMPGGKQGKAKAKGNAKAKPKQAKGTQPDKGNSSKSKNSSGPGKHGGRRGPSDKQPQQTSGKGRGRGGVAQRR